MSIHPAPHVDLNMPFNLPHTCLLLSSLIVVFAIQYSLLWFYFRVSIFSGKRPNWSLRNPVVDTVFFQNWSFTRFVVDIVICPNWSFPSSWRYHPSYNLVIVHLIIKTLVCPSLSILYARAAHSLLNRFVRPLRCNFFARPVLSSLTRSKLSQVA